MASESNLSLKDLEEANLGKPFYVEQVTPTAIRVVDVNGTPRLEVSYTGQRYLMV
jgi:hypothetical protein